MDFFVDLEHVEFKPNFRSIVNQRGGLEFSSLFLIPLKNANKYNFFYQEQDHFHFSNPSAKEKANGILEESTVLYRKETLFCQRIKFQ